MTRERWMALSFGIGTVCFLIAPLTAYGKLVGDRADDLTYFVGSIPFTVGGGFQSWLAFGERRSGAAGRALWRAAWIQSVGTLWFNLMTVRALVIHSAAAHYNLDVWAPNAVGSACFLISGLIVYRYSPRRRWLPAVGGPGWYEAGVNLLGCVLFGLSAVTGFARVGGGGVLYPRVSNGSTSLGAACFLICAVGTLLSGHTVKSARLRRLAGEIEHGVVALGHEVGGVEREIAREVVRRR